MFFKYKHCVRKYELDNGKYDSNEIHIKYEDDERNKLLQQIKKYEPQHIYLENIYIFIMIN